MEHTALRPKPMPGREPGDGPRTTPTPRPRAARRRGRRFTTALFALFVGAVLVLSGVGLGTVGATVIGMSKLAEAQQAQQASTRAHAAPSASLGPRPAPAATAARATLGVEAVDAEKAGARLVGVHVPGPGYAAGLVRGDILLAFGRTRVDSATDLARAVAKARPGREVTLTVRHASGGYQQLVVVPGVVT
ncbi:PDZ domain-containing protein [Streptomyces sp. FZ201]|uniref:PDZ domain-containing protein n=1 Tax=Streptomyces sp. FZ201 TaxID=3057122 RepID=UPI0021BDFB08|nr:PDZ domain-containing protein [Streptomyces sp. FZ201]